jgi:hypothetical protein
MRNAIASTWTHLIRECSGIDPHEKIFGADFIIHHEPSDALKKESR